MSQKFVLNEESIRPSGLFNDYLKLCEDDCHELFDIHDFEWRSCCLCGVKNEPVSEPIVKHGFSYHFCASCNSLFANPAPSAKSLARFYKEGKSVKFWATDFYKQTAENRAQLIVKPKAELLIQDIRKLKLSGSDISLIDIGAGFGLFLGEFSKISPATHLCAIEPGPQFVCDLMRRGVNVVEKFIEDVEPSDLRAIETDADLLRVFVSHELLEHLLRPREFFEKMRSLMRAGDLLSFTTLTASGFDILYLKEESKAVHPPHHLSFFTVDQLRKVISDNSLEVIRLSTPGELDVDIVKKSERFKDDRLMRTLINSAEAAVAFQEFLKTHNRSSHVNVLCRAL